MELIEKYRKALAGLAAPIEEAEVNIDTNERYDIWIQNGALARSEAHIQTKIYAYATIESTGMVYTEDTEEDPHEVFGRAAENSRFLQNQRRVLNGRKIVRHPDKGAMASIPELEKLGLEIEKRSGYPVAELMLSTCCRSLVTLNSLGLDSRSQTSWTEVQLEIKSEKAIGTAFSSAASIGSLDAAEIAKKAIAAIENELVSTPDEVRITSGSYSTVLSAQVMRNIFMTGWLEFSAARMQRPGSLFQDRKGLVVGSDKINIVNSPSHPLIGQVWEADSEGSETVFQQVVKDGVLQMPLYTIDSLRNSKDSKQSGFAGCAGRVPMMTGNIPIELTTVPANFYFEPGTLSEDELVEQMKDGILLTYSLDLFHSVNIASGDFSVPCGGFLIRDGKRVGRLSQITMSGNLRDLLKGVRGVADNLGFDYFYFRTYCIGSPSMWVERVNFSG